MGHSALFRFSNLLQTRVFKPLSLSLSSRQWQAASASKQQLQSSSSATPSPSIFAHPSQTTARRTVQLVPAEPSSDPVWGRPLPPSWISSLRRRLCRLIVLYSKSTNPHKCLGIKLALTLTYLALDGWFGQLPACAKLGSLALFEFGELNGEVAHFVSPPLRRLHSGVFSFRIVGRCAGSIKRIRSIEQRAAVNCQLSTAVTPTCQHLSNSVLRRTRLNVG